MRLSESLFLSDKLVLRSSSTDPMPREVQDARREISRRESHFGCVDYDDTVQKILFTLSFPAFRIYIHFISLAEKPLRTKLI